MGARPPLPARVDPKAGGTVAPGHSRALQRASTAKGVRRPASVHRWRSERPLVALNAVWAPTSRAASERRPGLRWAWITLATLADDTCSKPYANRAPPSGFPAVTKEVICAGPMSASSSATRHGRDNCADYYANSFICASACSSQNRMSISRYIVVAVVRCSWAS